MKLLDSIRTMEITEAIDVTKISHIDSFLLRDERRSTENFVEEL